MEKAAPSTDPIQEAAPTGDVKCPHCHYTTPHAGRLAKHLISHEQPQQPVILRLESGVASITLEGDNQIVPIPVPLDATTPLPVLLPDLPVTLPAQPAKRRRRAVEAAKPEALVKCPKCDYTAAHNSHLIAHSRVHTGERPFKCPECEYASALKGNLTTHRRKHSGDKPFKCPSCDYAAADKSTLVRHINTHTKPFKCDKPDCPYATAQKRDLRTHLTTHRDKPFKCEECTFAAADKERLDKHYISKHVHTASRKKLPPPITLSKNDL